MSDHQALIQNIRGFLASNFQVKNDEVVAWAEQYARLCREANDRLRQCGDYLKKRLRGEAIHAAEAEPNLLDMVAALDLPELPEWKETCFRFELADPPALLMDTAAALNEAYAQEQPLDGLMAYHRLMALARAPLRNRLLVMRKLEAADTTSAVMEEDIRTFERLRLEEIRAAVPMLARANDLEGVRRVQDELTESWRITVPVELRRLVDDVEARFRRAAGEAELRRLMPPLAEAYSAMAFDETSALLKQFLASASSSQVAIPPDLQEQIDPMFQWLADYQERREHEAAFAEACNAFQQAIDVGAPTPKLDAAYRESLRFNMELDPRLEGSYRKTLRDRAAAIRTKRITIWSSIAGAFILLAGVAAVLIYQTLRAHEVRDALAVLQQATADVDGGGLDRVRAVVKQVVDEHPRIKSDPAIIRAMEDFTRVSTAEQQRQDLFKENMKVAEAAGPAQPDHAALTAAAGVARLPDELAAVADLRTRIADHLRGIQGKLDDQFLREAVDLGREIDKSLTGELLAGHPEMYADQITKFNDRIQQLGGRTEVSDSIRKLQVKSLSALLRPKQEKLDDSKTELALLEQVKRATTAEEQGSAIKAYLAKSTDSRHTAEFQKAAALVPAEQSVEAWGKLSREMTGPLLPVSYQAATARIAELQKYADDNGSSPLLKPIGDYIAYLKMGQQVAGPEGPWKSKYHDLLQNTLVHDLFMLEASDGKRYYVLGNPNIKTKAGQFANVSFEAVLTSDVSKKDTVKLTPPVTLKTPAPVPSPQAAYAERTTARLEKLDFLDWETVGTRVIRELLAEKDIHPVLRAILLKNALEQNQPLMTWSGDTACKGVFDALAAKGIDDVEWMNPNNQPPAELVAKLNQIVGQLPRIDDLDAAVRRKRDAAVAGLPMGLAVSGMLLKEDNAMKLETRGSTPEGATAYAVTNHGNFATLAHRQGGKWVIDTVQALDVPGGSLVFVCGPR